MKITYFSHIDKATSPGVAKKIANSVTAINELGHEAMAYNSEKGSLKQLLKYLIAILQCDSDILFIRYSIIPAIPLFFVILIKRLFGVKVLVDVPTPRRIGLKEIDQSNYSFPLKMLSKLILQLQSSWVLWPTHRVIQYADESLWFNFGVRHKTLKMGNGIKIDPNKPVVNFTKPPKTLNMIAVAQLADWHGYDRLISAMRQALDKHPDLQLNLTVVGGGDALPGLQSLTKELKLEQNVTFTGWIQPDQLDSVFADKYVGIASLGVYRKRLGEASDLKTREYMSRGLSVIGVGKDPDIPADSPYRYVVPNDDSIEPLSDMIIHLADEELPNPFDVYGFAVSSLSLAGKMRKVLSSI